MLERAGQVDTSLVAVLHNKWGMLLVEELEAEGSPGFLHITEAGKSSPSEL